MPDDFTDFASLAQNPPWRVRPLLLVMIDLRDWLFRYTAVNLAWFILSLTIILLPPATIALYEVAWRSYHGEEPSLRLFWQGMKQYALVSYVWAGLLLLVLLIGGSALLFYVTQGVFWGVVLAVAVTVLLLGLLTHYLPYLVLEGHPLRALKNAVFTALADPFLVLMQMLIWLIFGIPGVVTLAPLMFILPMIFALIGMYSLLDWLHHHEHLQGEQRQI